MFQQGFRRRIPTNGLDLTRASSGTSASDVSLYGRLRGGVGPTMLLERARSMSTSMTSLPSLSGIGRDPFKSAAVGYIFE